MVFSRSLRVRLTFWYVLLVALILAAFSAGVYLALRQTLNESLKDSLENRSEVLLGFVSYEGSRPTLDSASVPGDPAEGEHFARVFDASGEITFDNSAPDAGISVDQADVQQALNGSGATRHATVGGRPLRVLTTPITAQGRVVGALEVGLSEDDVREPLRLLLLIITLAYPLTLAAAGAGGIFLAGRALAPIDSLTGLARRISAEDLSERLDLDLPDDELGRLARTFDEMITRLDDSFRRQRQFTADASHELRTPLTVIKGQSEVALQRERDPEDYRAVLRSINDEVDRMIRLVGSLLTLARADAGEIPLTRDKVSVESIVTAATEHVRAVADAKGLSLTVEAGPGVTLEGDEDLLLQLLLNLLDNAVKFTPAGGHIRSGWQADGSYVAVWVCDSGPGIDAEHTQRIFDRFYRVDKARSRAAGGAGLGLSISRWIAEAHGGSISVESKLGSGSTFTARVPLAH